MAHVKKRNGIDPRAAQPIVAKPQESPRGPEAAAHGLGRAYSVDGMFVPMKNHAHARKWPMYNV